MEAGSANLGSSPLAVHFTERTTKAEVLNDHSESPRTEAVVELIWAQIKAKILY